MRKQNKQKVFLGLLTTCAFSCIVTSGILSGNVLTKDSSVKDCMLTNDLALTACDVKTNEKQFPAEKSSVPLSDISVSAGSANLDIATLEDTNVPIVMAATTITEMAEEVTITPAAVTGNAIASEEAVSAQSESEWQNKAMAKVEESANIRVTPDTEGELAGRFRKGDGAEILERGAEWTKISSGNVVGYVKNEYLAFDEEAKQLAEQYGTKTATIQTETLRVRSESSEEAEILDLVSGEGKYTVVSEENEWVKIRLRSGDTGYVATQYVDVEFELGNAISIEEEQAAKEAARKKAEEKAAKAAAKAESKEKSERSNPKVTQEEAVTASPDDETLLGALIQMEAGGEGYDCKLAVASVVMNRVNSSRFPGSISGVIYQSGQFPGASNGKLARILKNGVNSSCMNAAQDALNGKRNVNYLYFNTKNAVSTSRLSDYTIIGSECFY